MNSPLFIHPLAICESEKTGSGTRIWAFAHVMKDAVIGTDCNIGEGVFVEGGAQIGDRVTVKNQVLIWSGVKIEAEVFVGPAVIFTNDRRPRSPRSLEYPQIKARYQDTKLWLTETVVERGASLGAGAIICSGITIGAYAMIGAGAVVTRSVQPHELVLGNPGRVRGHVCFCGEKATIKNEASYFCEKCISYAKPVTT